MADSLSFRVDFADAVASPGGDWTCGPIAFRRNESPDGIVPELVTSTDGGQALRLAVRSGAYPGPLKDETDNGNQRCELRIGAKVPTGTQEWFGLSLRVPAGFPVRERRLVVAQIKVPYAKSSDSSPAFAIRIDDGHWLATIEHLFEPEDLELGRYLRPPEADSCLLPAVPAKNHSDFRVGSDTYCLQVRAVLATERDGLPDHLVEREFTTCTTGVKVGAFAPLPDLGIGGGWTDFLIHFQSSKLLGLDGFVELYANGARIARAEGELGYAESSDPSQYFKIGPYRTRDAEWGAEDCAIEVRNIRRGRTRQEVELGPQV